MEVEMNDIFGYVSGKRQNGSKKIMGFIKLLMFHWENKELSNRKLMEKIKCNFKNSVIREVKQLKELEKGYEFVKNIKTVIGDWLFEEASMDKDDAIYAIIGEYLVYHEEQFKNNKWDLLQFDIYINHNVDSIAAPSSATNKYNILNCSLLKAILSCGDYLNDKEKTKIFTQANINYIKWYKDNKELIECLKLFILKIRDSKVVIFIMKRLYHVFKESELLKINRKFIQFPEILKLIQWDDATISPEMFLDLNENGNYNNNNEQDVICNDNDNNNNNNNHIDDIKQIEGGSEKQYKDILNEINQLFDTGDINKIEEYILFTLIYDNIMNDAKYASLMHFNYGLFAMFVLKHGWKARRAFSKSLKENETNLEALYFHAMLECQCMNNIEKGTMLFQKLYSLYDDPPNIIGIDSDKERAEYKIQLIQTQYEQSHFKKKINTFLTNIENVNSKPNGSLFCWLKSIKNSILQKFTKN